MEALSGYCGAENSKITCGINFICAENYLKAPFPEFSVLKMYNMCNKFWWSKQFQKPLCIIGAVDGSINCSAGLSACVCVCVCMCVCEAAALVASLVVKGLIKQC